jgi:hypothetical protein
MRQRPDALVQAWSKASSEERRQLLEHIGVNELVAVMPAVWWSEIERRVGATQAFGPKP